MVAVVVHEIVILIAPVESLGTSVAQSVSVFICVLFARNPVLTYVAPAVAVLVYARNRFITLVTTAVVILVGAHLVEASIAYPALVFVRYDSTSVGHPYSAIVTEVIIFFVVYMIPAGYGTKSFHLTYVTHAVSVFINAKIIEAATADITDVITVGIYVSVVVGIHRLAAVVTMSVIVIVGAVKRIIAGLAGMTAINAQVQALPYDVILNILCGHLLVGAIVACELVARNE